jgi:hypothetical protein
MSEADTKTREKLSVIPKGHWRNKFHSVRDAVFADGTVNKAGTWFAVMEWPSAEVAEAVAAKHMVEFAGWVEAVGITYLGPVFFPAQDPRP